MSTLATTAGLVLGQLISARAGASVAEDYWRDWIGHSRDQPVTGERLKISLNRIGNTPVIDLAAVHVDREGLLVFFLLEGFSIVAFVHSQSGQFFDAVLFCGGDILSGVELTFGQSAMPGRARSGERRLNLRGDLSDFRRLSFPELYEAQSTLGLD